MARAEKPLNFLKVWIDPNQLRELREALSPSQYRQAIFQAVKKTTNKVRKIIGQRVAEHSYIKPSYIKDVIQTVQPKGDPPAGLIIVRQQRLSLLAFKGVKALKRSGVTVQVSADRAPITLKHAFKAKVASAAQKEQDVSHQGIFVRTRHTPSKGPNKGLKVTRGPNKGKPRYRLTPEGFAGRLAIKEEFGPSVLSIVEFPKVFEEISFDTQEDLAKQVNSQMDRFLKPKGGGTPPPSDS